VGIIVNGRPAGIHAHLGRVKRGELAQAARIIIVKLKVFHPVSVVLDDFQVCWLAGPYYKANPGQ